MSYTVHMPPGEYIDVPLEWPTLSQQDILGLELDRVVYFFSNSAIAKKHKLVIKKMHYGYADVNPETTHWGLEGISPDSKAKDFFGWVIHDPVHRRKAFVSTQLNDKNHVSVLTIRGPVVALGNNIRPSGLTKTYSAGAVGNYNLISAALTRFFTGTEPKHTVAPEVQDIVDRLHAIFNDKIAVDKFRYDRIPNIYALRMNKPAGVYFTEVYVDRYKMPRILFSDHADGKGLINVAIVESWKKSPEWQIYSLTGQGYPGCLTLNDDFFNKIKLIIKKAL